MGSAGQTPGRARRGTHRFGVGSLRSRTRGARGPSGRWWRPDSGGRGNQPARESRGGHGLGRGGRWGAVPPRTAPRGGAGCSPALLAGAGSHWPEAGAARGGAGLARLPPTPLGESAWDTPARALGIPGSSYPPQFPLAKPGGKPGKAWAAVQWGLSTVRPSPALGAKLPAAVRPSPG